MEHVERNHLWRAAGAQPTAAGLANRSRHDRAEWAGRAVRGDLGAAGGAAGFGCHVGGRGPGQRPSTGIFIYTTPKDQIQKNHNKEALKLLEVKKSQATIDQQAIGSAFIPAHKFKANFLEYYEEYVKLNARKRNRHLANSLAQFKLFIKRDFIAPIDITENFCKRFRQFLLDKYTGKTPGNYYARFK